MRKDEQIHIYSIRQLIELTGVSEFTLRGWETRYQAFNPARSETGRRLYCKEDIIKIRLLMRLLSQGHRIGMIAPLTVKKLELLAEEEASDELAIETKAGSNVKMTAKIAEIMSLAGRFEWEKIQKAFIKVQESLGARNFVLEFLLGLIGEMNEQIEAGRFSVAQEHIMTALMKERLYAATAFSETKSHGTYRFVLAAPEGDFHDLGLLIAAVLLSLFGIKYVNLGPHVPQADLCEVSLRFNATHILLSSTLASDLRDRTENDYLKYVNFLDRQLSNDICLLLGGRNASTETLVLKRKFKIINSFSDFEAFIDQLRKK